MTQIHSHTQTISPSAESSIKECIQSCLLTVSLPFTPALQRDRPASSLNPFTCHQQQEMKQRKKRIFFASSLLSDESSISSFSFALKPSADSCCELNRLEHLFIITFSSLPLLSSLTKGQMIKRNGIQNKRGKHLSVKGEREECV